MGMEGYLGSNKDGLARDIDKMKWLWENKVKEALVIPIRQFKDAKGFRKFHKGLNLATETFRASAYFSVHIVSVYVIWNLLLSLTLVGLLIWRW